MSEISNQLFSGNISPFGALSSLVGNLALAVAVLISSFYLCLTRDGIERFIKMVLPADIEEISLRIYGRAHRKIGYWFKTQILLSLIVGISVGISLLILGVKHALVIGIFAGIFELAPYVGPILSGAIAVTTAWTTSVILAFYTLIVFLAIHELESNVLIPILMKRVIGLHPVIVITSLLIGVEAGGILGLIVAVPMAAVLQEIIKERSESRKLREVKLEV